MSVLGAAYVGPDPLPRVDVGDHRIRLCQPGARDIWAGVAGTGVDWRGSVAT